MQLSIVSSLYQSAPYIKEFVERVSATASKVADSYEIILVNDGSTDDSLHVARSLQKLWKNIKIIDLSRNFGHHKALMTGLRHATGERIYLTDCDLEEPPEVLEQWWSLLDKDPELDVVLGVQSVRDGSRFVKLSGTVFYHLIKWLSPVSLPKNSIVSRLMTARYVAEVVKYKDRDLYLFGIMAFVGFKQIAQPVLKHKKELTTYTLFRRLALFGNAVTSFSNYPLYYILVIGMVTTLFSLLYLLYCMFQWFFGSEQLLPGWTSIVVSIWFLGGVVLTSIGVIAIYVAKIFTEVKDRPFSVVRDVYEASEQQENTEKLKNE